MRKVKWPEITDYVLATMWTDKDPKDPWCIGFIKEIIIDIDGPEYVVEGNQRRWKHVWKLTMDEGYKWIELHGNNKS